ncbi:MAG: DUF2153 domain-containing protein [archaeon GB-1867-005]|nr:DUF2153 domain-containing protein [Candidatus Culexmicrobium cathedralense]
MLGRAAVDYEEELIMYRVDPDLIKRLEAWVEDQKRFLEYSKLSLKELEKADRLTLIIAARTACAQILRTIKGFENWLQNPVVIGLMPYEMAKEVQEKLWQIMVEVTNFDIKHTSEYKDFLKKVIEEGRVLPPFPPEERRRLTYTR